MEEEGQEGISNLTGKALDIAKQVGRKLLGVGASTELVFLASGGCNHVWLATSSLPSDQKQINAAKGKDFVFRMPRDTPSLQPFQFRHEVACLQFVSKKLPNIPVPKIYAWDDGSSISGQIFAAEEFREGQRLSTAWPQLEENENSQICLEIANVVATLGKHDSIPSMDQQYNHLQTKFHSPRCYNIGPYQNSKEYIISCYDNEIFYYTHADDDDLILEAFEETSVADFVTNLKLERQALVEADSIFREIDAEPLVLVHEDFHAGNMIVRDGHIVGILDWEFSGIYLLSELMGSIAILQISAPHRDELTEEEELRWEERYRHDVGVVVRERGWKHENIKALMCGGRPVLQKARSIMFPKGTDS